jgi:hypothetical protein
MYRGEFILENGHEREKKLDRRVEFIWHTL